MTKEEYIAKEIDENPSLAEMTDAILDACDEDNQGFFATIESGDIDWAGHSNNIDALIGAVNDFDKAVENVIKWIGENGGWERNMLVVTADLDHYLTLTDDFPNLIRSNSALDLAMGGDIEHMGHYWGPANLIRMVVKVIQIVLFQFSTKAVALKSSIKVLVRALITTGNMLEVFLDLSTKFTYILP